MRIISDFRDYYDGLATFDRKDPMTRIWERTSCDYKIEVDKKFFKYFDETKFPFLFSNHWDLGFLIISGKVHPFIRHWIPGEWKNIWSKKEKYVDSHYDYYYNFKTLFEKVPTLVERWGKKEIKQFFNLDIYPDMTALCLEVKSPIIVFYPRGSHYFRAKLHGENLRSCKVNANLKDMGVSKLYSSPEIYQMLDYFVSNVMVDDQMPKVKQTDVEKIESHGFDKVISFRHRK